MKSNRSILQPFNPVNKLNEKILDTLKNFAHNIGVIYKATIYEINTPQVTTTAKDLKNLPIIPPINKTGPKIQTKDKKIIYIYNLM